MASGQTKFPEIPGRPLFNHIPNCAGLKAAIELMNVKLRQQKSSSSDRSSPDLSSSDLQNAFLAWPFDGTNLNIPVPVHCEVSPAGPQENVASGSGVTSNLPTPATTTNEEIPMPTNQPNNAGNVPSQAVALAIIQAHADRHQPNTPTSFPRHQPPSPLSPFPTPAPSHTPSSSSPPSDISPTPSPQATPTPLHDRPQPPRVVTAQFPHLPTEPEVPEPEVPEPEPEVPEPQVPEPEPEPETETKPEHAQGQHLVQQRMVQTAPRLNPLTSFAQHAYRQAPEQVSEPPYLVEDDGDMNFDDLQSDDPEEQEIDSGSVRNVSMGEAPGPSGHASSNELIAAQHERWRNSQGSSGTRSFSMGVGEDSSLVRFEEEGQKREGAGVHGTQYSEGEPISETMGIVPDAPHHLQSNPPINPSPSLASTSVVIVGQERSMEIDCNEMSLQMEMLPDNVPVAPPTAGNVPVIPQPVGNVPVAYQHQVIGANWWLPDNVLVAPQAEGIEPVGHGPVAPQHQVIGADYWLPNNVPVAPQAEGDVPAAPQLGQAEMNSLERRQLQRSTQ
eukprot:gene31435-6613_t